MAVSRRTWFSVAMIAAALWLWFFLNGRSESGVEAALTAQPAPVAAAQEPTAAPAEAPSNEARSELPPLGTHAQRRQWVHSTFGDRPEQLGRKKIEGETYPPQGFAVTPDGDLLVLDIAKKRLVRYGRDGKIEQVTALPVPTNMLADVAVAADGTIALIDYPGVRTTLLDAHGKQKAQLPHPGALTGLYAAGNDFYVDTDGLSSVKVGNTQGVASAETPALHQQQDGSIAGHVAPDGKTVLRIHLDDATTGDFSVFATRGNPPEEVFTRHYRYPNVSGFLFIQADAAGRIYAVIITELAQLVLVCLDGKTGNPVGAMEMPLLTGLGGTQLRMFNVAPEGGLVYALIRESDVRYEWFDCHP